MCGAPASIFEAKLFRGLCGMDRWLREFIGTRGARGAVINPPVWDFRTSESPTGKRIVFCRCAVGETPALWVMNTHGGSERLLTRGIEESDADQPRWLPSQR
jgi:Tol biopolymer transport system component